MWDFTKTRETPCGRSVFLQVLSWVQGYRKPQSWTTVNNQSIINFNEETTWNERNNPFHCCNINGYTHFKHMHKTYFNIIKDTAESGLSFSYELYYIFLQNDGLHNIWNLWSYRELRDTLYSTLVHETQCRF